MRVLEESSNKLKHEFKIEIPSTDIEDRIVKSLTEYGKTAKIPGFRPGKIPLDILKNRYEAAARKDALNDALKDSMTSVLNDKSLKPAKTPEIDFSQYTSGENLTFTMKVEALPQFEIQDYSKVSIQKLNVNLTEDDVEKDIIKFLESLKRTTPVEKSRKAKAEDTVVIDALAFLGEKEIPQHDLKDLPVNLGSGRLQEFEKSLTGLEPGDTVDIDYKLSESMEDKNLAGKTITFKTTVKELREPAKIELNQETAELFKFKDLEEMKTEGRQQLERSLEEPVFLFAKRQVLDSLDKLYKFDLPECLVEEEFKLIWEDAKQELEHEAKHNNDKTPSQKEMDELEKKYRSLAERRVRLGLVLSAIGVENKITVPKEKMTQALIQAARQHKGYEKEAFDYYIKNNEALARIRAPLLEDEVVSFIMGHADVKEKEVTVKQLMDEIEKMSKENI